MTTQQTARPGQFGSEIKAGEWNRQGNRFTDRITADSDSKPGEGATFHFTLPRHERTD